MALTLAGIRDIVGKRLQLSTQDIPDEVIDDAVTDALEEFAEVRELNVFGSFATSGNVQDYPFPTEADALTQVAYSTGLIIEDAFAGDPDLKSFFERELFNFGFGGNVFDNPSLGQIFFQKLHSFKTRFFADFEVLDRETGRIVRLLSTPQSDGTAFWEGAKKRILTTVSEQDEKSFLKGVLWKVCEARAAKLAVVEQISESGGISMKPATTFWVKKAEKFEKSFKADFGASAGFIMRG